MIDFSWLTFFAILLSSLIIHELGHLFLLGKYNKYKDMTLTLEYIATNKSWQIRAGKREDYIHLSKYQRNKVYVMGLFCQVLYIGLFGWYLNWLYFFIISFAIIVSVEDLKKAEII